MEKFYLESPSIKRKDEAINYVKEFYENNSNLNGDSGLDKYLDDYEECITNLSNSILKHFNCTTYHNTLSFIDKILDKNLKVCMQDLQKMRC